jgi:hypothetical protein
MTISAVSFAAKTSRLLMGGLAVLAALPMSARADPVTYDFTGTVVSVNDLTGVSVGMPVTGTYTFDFANSNPAELFGTIGSSAPEGWAAGNSGGAQFSTSAPTLSQFVFSSTATVGAVSYSTNPGCCGGYWNSSSVSAGFPSDQQAMFYAQELVAAQTFGQYLDSYLQLKDFGATPWAPDGLPVYVDSTQNMGGFESVNGSGDAFVSFHIDSLEQAGPVAVPAPGPLPLVALGVLALLLSHRRAARQSTIQVLGSPPHSRS